MSGDHFTKASSGSADNTWQTKHNINIVCNVRYVPGADREMRMVAPKTVLHNFYQGHSQRQLVGLSYEVAPTTPVGWECRWHCTLSYPEVTVGGRRFAQAVFNGDGSTKRKAEDAASQKALDALEMQGFE